MKNVKYVTILSLFLLAAPVNAFAGEVSVAVAANFTDAAKEIGQAFEKKTGNKVAYSFGASGQFYNQISNGAPFDVFLSADKEKPQKLEKDGLATPNTRFDYAYGRLALYSADNKKINGPAVLYKGDYNKIAIANPSIAPYGVAAVQALAKMKVYQQAKPKIVFGNSISQAYVFTQTGAADIGMVALSEIYKKTDGSRWVVPNNYYSPIMQDAILLKRAQNNKAAIDYINFLKSSAAKNIIKSYGYGIK